MVPPVVVLNRSTRSGSSAADERTTSPHLGRRAHTGAAPVRMVLVTIVAAEKYVLYLLRELGTANEHHRFEDISTRLARIRVSSNIVLAVGPVSSGGDQGRDAESFFTRLPDEMPGAAGFIGRASTKPVVVACTVQQKDLTNKIKSDLDSICTQGEPVDHVAYFTAASVPIAAEHTCKEYARRTYNVGLDVFSGPTVASMLVEPDAIWIAQSLLDLPESMVPDRPEEATIPDWYRRDLAVIRNSSRPLTSAGDLSTVSDGMRYAAAHSDVGGDLGDWMRAAERLIVGAGESDLGVTVAARARYELIVASVRGVGSFSPRIDQRAHELLDMAVDSDDPGLLLDGSTALMFCGGMWVRHGTALEVDDLEDYLERLREQVSELIAAVDTSIYPLRHARLLAAAAHLSLHPRWGRVVRRPAGSLPPMTESIQAVNVGMRIPEPGAALPFDIDHAMEHLAAFAEIAPAARGLPIQELSACFDIMAPLFAADPRYLGIRDALDAATAELLGDEAAGNKARDRAVALRAAGRPLHALRELHDAKVRWFHGDTLRGAVLTMVVIAKIYRELGLPHAAKQYALAAAAAATTAAKPDVVADLVAPAIVFGSICSYDAGAWFDAVALGHIARMAHAHFAEHAYDYDEHSELHDLDLTEAFVVSAARAFRPALLPAVEALLTEFGTWESVSTMLDDAGPYPYAEDQFDDMVADQLVGIPCSDTGPQRHLRFAALGTTWNVTCRNDRATALAAERFAAATQVLICDLALLDPVFLPSRLEIDVSTDTPLDRNRVRFQTANDRISCRVYLPRYSEGEQAGKFEPELMSVVAVLAATVSALPQSTFMSKVKACAAAGLFNRVVVVQPYDSVAGLLDDSHYSRLAALSDARIGELDSTAMVRSELASPTSPGPGYDQADSLERAQWRYEHLPKQINQTLPRVIADEGIRAHLVRLRGDGWLDWQLLLALHNVTVNAGIRRDGLAMDDPAQREETRRRFHDSETEATALVPLAEFTPEAIDMQLEIGLTLALHNLRLESHTDTPDFVAIARLLRDRYGYGTDDVAHADLLAGDDASS